MQLKGTVQLELVAGPGPLQVQAVISFIGDDGTVYNTEAPQPLAPGHTLTYGPVWATVAVTSEHKYAPTPKKDAGTQPVVHEPAAPAPKPPTAPVRR
jgi:hypothetical protein